MTSRKLQFRERLADIIAKNGIAKREELLADTPFFDLGCDSLDVVEIGIMAEQEFGVDLQGKVNVNDLPQTLSDMVSLIEKHLPRNKEVSHG